MNRFLALVSISIFAAPILMAGDQESARVALKPKPVEQTAPAESKDKPGDQPGATVLKNKSSFNIDAGTRSPFWPIGWKPTGKVASGGGTDQGEVPPGAFLVSSITLDERHFAIINGKSMSEGQTFGLQIGTQIYQVTVKRIEDGQVILARHDEEIVVPLRRK